VKEDAPDMQVRHFDNILARKKKKEKREKGKRSCKLRERDVRLARLRHERRVKAEEEGIPLNEVESSTEEDLSGWEDKEDEDEGTEDDDGDDDEGTTTCSDVPSLPRSQANKPFVQEDVLEWPQAQQPKGARVVKGSAPLRSRGRLPVDLTLELPNTYDVVDSVPNYSAVDPGVHHYVGAEELSQTVRGFGPLRLRQETIPKPDPETTSRD
jgi:hypothetical protein